MANKKATIVPTITRASIHFGGLQFELISARVPKNRMAMAIAGIPITVNAWANVIK